MTGRTKIERAMRAANEIAKTVDWDNELFISVKVPKRGPGLRGALIGRVIVRDADGEPVVALECCEWYVPASGPVFRAVAIRGPRYNDEMIPAEIREAAGRPGGAITAADLCGEDGSKPDDGASELVSSVMRAAREFEPAVREVKRILNGAGISFGAEEAGDA